MGPPDYKSSALKERPHLLLHLTILYIVHSKIALKPNREIEKNIK